MKRYKIDLSANDFFGLIKVGAIDENTEFEAYDVPTVTTPKAAAKKAVRKARRTKAQIEADKAVSQKQAEPEDIGTPNRAFPWKDPEMNKAS